MFSLAVRREPEPGEGQDADALAAVAGDASRALADLAAAGRRIEAHIPNATGSQPLLTGAMVRVGQATQAAEEIRDAIDALARREIRVREIADAAVAADRARRRLRLAP